MKTDYAHLDLATDLDRRIDWSAELPFGEKRPAWIDRISRGSFAGLLVCICALLYGHTLGDGFALDDYRHLTRMKEVNEGRRAAPELFRFLTSAEANAAARRSGEYPWWITDDVRYQHWRPAAGWALYGQYLLFGHSAWPYRLVSLLLYAAGVLAVVALYRRLTSDERVARRAALLFTVLAGHAIPAVFISSQADSVALLLTCGSLLSALRFAESGSRGAALASLALYAVALGFKEAVLPLAIMPALLGWWRLDPRERRRLRACTGIMLAAGLVWMAAYARGGFGANNAIMLDPIHAPAAYLAALPVRAAVLMAALVIPVNPFVFYLRPGFDVALAAFAIAGTLVFIACAAGLLRRSPAAIAKPAVLWPLVFLPLLACTVPDDRVLMLPSIGFALMIALWWSVIRRDRPRLARRAVWTLAGAHGGAALVASFIMGLIATDGRESIQLATACLKQPPAAGDCLIFLNSIVDSQVLFARDRARHVTGVDQLLATFASSANAPTVQRTGERTLQLSAASGGLLDGFLGRMGVSWRREIETGDAFDAGAFTARVLETDGAIVKRIELIFAEPLDCGRYHFFRVRTGGVPEPWPGLPCG